ncbi:FG-GAP-like repeat-containing protein [Nocardioides sp. 616]|uniref:FG-GAP-like repeat-containing protein n=1 Tax=Nocardioides sp. 616 TaxID=2268090 RepID=UPI000CE4DD86|nr:FG-GAP-like repeat-containing protein [Nocardioides sp. 616]
MFELLWVRALLVAVATLTSSLGAGTLQVPSTPLVASAVQLGPQEIFADSFDAAAGPVTDRWEHQASSTPERTELVTHDGRSALRVRPEGNLISLQAVPFSVGTTYRVSAVISMPRRTGTHPAFWLRTKDAAQVAEIDVVESWGGEDRCGRVHLAFYWQYFPRLGNMRCRGEAYPADMVAWHEYATEFTYMGPGRDPANGFATPTRFFVDGVETWSVDRSPMAPEFLRIQHKRNCPDAEQPGCGETGTGPSMYVDHVSVQVVGRPPTGDPAAGVHAVTTTPSGVLELHALDPATSYSSFATQTSLPLGGQGWRTAKGDYNGDLVTDLFAVDPAGTVHVLDGATGFQTFLAQTGVAGIVDLSLASGTEISVGDDNGDGRADLYVISRDAENRTAVTVLDAANTFQAVLVQGGTAFPALDPLVWTIAAGDHDNDGRADLYAISSGQDGGSAAVHVLDARTGFQTFLTQTATALTAPDLATWKFTVGDYNDDGRADLYALDRDDNGLTAVHVLDAATGFESFLTQTTTALHQTTDPAWDLS